MNVGDSFYVFGRELLGRGYELQKRWITSVAPGWIRHAGGATESGDSDAAWPWSGDPDPRVAFERGKARNLSSLAAAKEELEKKLADLAEQERKFIALQFEDVRQRGNDETYEQFKRNWDCDY